MISLNLNKFKKINNSVQYSINRFGRKKRIKLDVYIKKGTVSEFQFRFSKDGELF